MTFGNKGAATQCAISHPRILQAVLYRGARACTRARYIAIDFGVAAKSMSENLRNIQWMETREWNHAHAEVHGSTWQLAWLDFRTCMVPLTQVHGSALTRAWFSFFDCIQWTQKRLQVTIPLILLHRHGPACGRLLHGRLTVARAIHHNAGHVDLVLLQFGTLKRIHLERTLEESRLWRISELQP